MKTRALLAASVLLGTLAWSAGASAQELAVATGNVNMRTGPGTGYPVIMTIPAGAQVQVFGCPSWCQVAYAGQQGWASSNYISTGFAQRQVVPGYAYQPAPVVRYAYRPAYAFGGPVIAFGGSFDDDDWRWRRRGDWWDDDDWHWRRHDDDFWWGRPRSGVSFEFGF
jgi:uncharacterized protein YraI